MRQLGHGRQLEGRGLTAAAVLTLPLWLGSCAPGSAPSGGGVPDDATAMAPTEMPWAVPVPTPQPQAPPPPGTASTGTRTATSGLPTDRQATGGTVTAYYVLLDDGGAKGVRFGCNDSLAAVRRPAAGPIDPLAAAMNTLLDGSAEPGPGLYNALSASTLNFLSGTFDGSTVTVYLAGALRPGGICDVPRVEAQLTQTAVSAVGAIRAEVYVNGMGLAAALSLK